MLAEMLDGFGNAAAHDRALTQRQLGHAFAQELVGLGVGDKGEKRRPADRQLVGSRSLNRRGSFEHAPHDLAPSAIRQYEAGGRTRISATQVIPSSPLPSWSREPPRPAADGPGSLSPYSGRRAPARRRPPRSA